MPDGSLAPQTIRSTAGLIAAGLATDAAGLDAVAERYAVAIPPAMAALITHPDDPIGRQVIPHPDELVTAAHELADPIGDDALSPVPGIVHRYADRALLKPLLVCPVYCRFCFRREHVGPDGGLLTDAQLDTALDWLRAHPAITEVILTGGDPLLLSPRRLGAILAALEAMPHVQTIRIHSRVPVAEPARLAALAPVLDIATPLWLVVHANHAREITPDVIAALRAVGRAGVPLLGQSVLLRGVNDSAEALEALFRAMLAARIKPYYLHQLDPAPGTARFHVPIEEGRRAAGRVARACDGAGLADLRAGYPRRPRQGADRPRLPRGRHRARPGRHAPRACRPARRKLDVRLPPHSRTKSSFR